jgi:hypothetical protein
MRRPSFALAWAKFQEVNIPVLEVGKKLGGHVWANIESGVFRNACPIRMSYVLNSTGVAVPHGGYAVVTDANRRRYLYRVRDLIRYLEKTFGRPEKTARSPNPAAFNAMKGILVIKGHGWNDAAGHATLWNGAVCADSCHMVADPDNGPFAPELGHLWVLS